MHQSIEKKCVHCWHPTGQVLLGLPEKIEYICCHCKQMDYEPALDLTKDCGKEFAQVEWEKTP